jgi:hypothetical protein
MSLSPGTKTIASAIRPRPTWAMFSPVVSQNVVFWVLKVMKPTIPSSSRTTPP